MCFKLQLLDTPTELIYKMTVRNEKYVNLVDIGKISPMAPQIGVKTCLNTHF